MKEGWKYVTLPDISENLDSKRKPVTKGKRESGKYPYYGASGIVDYVSNYIFDDNLLLISEDGANLLARTTPIAFSVSGKIWVNNHAHVIKFENRNTQRFVEYYFAAIDISDYVSGAAQPKFNQQKLNALPIPLPSLSEQQQIVDFLDAEFAKIDELKKQAEQSLQNAKDLFQAALKEMLTPKDGWKEYKFGDICKFIRGPFGGSLKKECFKDEGYPVYEQQNAIYNKFSFRYFINEEKYKSMVRFTVNPGDLIMSCSGTIGKVAIVPSDAPIGIINQALLKLTPTKLVFNEFLKYLMESSYFNEIIDKYSDGAAIKNIASVETLKSIVLTLPDYAIQKNIVNTLDELTSKATSLQSNYTRTIQLCADLKQALLRQVFE